MITTVCNDEDPKIKEACQKLLEFYSTEMYCSGNVADHNLGVD